LSNQKNRKVMKMKKLENWLIKLSDSLVKFKPLMILQSAFQMMLPFLIVGSICTVFNGLPIDAYQEFITNVGLKNVLGLPYNYTFGYFSIYLAFAVGYQYMIKNGMRKQAIVTGLMSILSTLIITPVEMLQVYIGTMGMFGAMVIAYITGVLVRFIVKRNWTIKMPEGVPSGISNSIMALVPIFVVVFAMMALNFVMSLTSLGDVQTALFEIVRLPLMKVGCNIFGEFIIFTMISLFWFFGVHGGMAIWPITAMLFTQNQAENLAAYSAGQAIPNMITGPGYLINYSMIAIVIAVLFFSKNNGLKSVAKVALFPAAFEIQEPISFGLPIIMNPIFLIPYVGTTLGAFLGTRILQLIGFLGNAPCISGFNQALPAVVNAFVNFGWKGILVSISFTIIAVFCYAPFVKMNDKRVEKITQEESEG